MTHEPEILNDSIVIRLNKDVKEGLKLLANKDKRKLADYCRIQLGKLLKK